MMHSQSQTRIRSPFAALLQKDIRLASQLMLLALIIVAAIAVIVTVLPLLGVVDVRDKTRCYKLY
jgi:cell division protein FtsL